MRWAGRGERLGRNADRLPDELPCAVLQERSSAKLPARLHATCQRTDAGALQIRVQSANGMIRDHVQRTGDRKSRHRGSACQRFELNDAEGVGVGLGKTKTSAAARWRGRSRPVFSPRNLTFG